MAERHGPTRTCIGCRALDARDRLVRYVSQRDGTGTVRLVRDDGRELPGRGAWLHDEARCRQLATKRRAFRRALRVAGDTALDDEIVHAERDDGAGHVTSPSGRQRKR